jgi:spermidine synthase
VTPLRYVFIATFFVSSSAIGYEILLMRMLSIVQWHHFAYMIISLALLGYGASGTLIALSRRVIEPRFETAFAICAFLMSVTMVACFSIGQRVPFNALEVVWDPRQLVHLLAIYLVFFVPFFFAASCIGLVFTCRKENISLIYFCDLLGAGFGASLIIAALFLLSPQGALKALAIIALTASVLASLAVPIRTRACLMALQVTMLLTVLLYLPQGMLDLKISPFKGLSQALQVVDTHVLAEYSSPLGLLTVVESPTIPFRDAPGLSFGARAEPPEQLAVFTDGDAMSVITRYDGNSASLAYLRDVPSALPYQLLDEPRVLILGAGGGTGVLSALYHGARSVDAVELNPLMTELVASTHADFAGNIYADERVTVHTGEARGFVTGQAKGYDLIQLALLDSFSASGSGVQALNESYLYTVEALREYLQHVEPGGILAIMRWLRVPPRDSLKMFATAVESLRRTGARQPGRQLALIRSWNTVTLLVKNGRLTDREIERIREFARSRSFDLSYYPGMPRGEANRYNTLPEPYLFDGASALLSAGANEFIERYKFDIRPAVDDRPYFFHFFKWSALPETLALRKRGGAGLIEWGYLILIATLVQALIAGGLLILLPLALSKCAWPRGTGPRMGSYFFLLGIAFMFVEIAFIQKLILFLSHPLYSVAVVLSGFLVFAGVGSACSKRISDRFDGTRRSAAGVVVAAIGAVSIIYVLFLPTVLVQLAGSPDLLRVGFSLLVIAPLGFFMGMPFPIGLARLASEAADFIPWAWGLNGFASVLSASLATLVAIEFGFSTVVLMALGLYLLAAALMNRRLL